MQTDYNFLHNLLITIIDQETFNTFTMKSNILRFTVAFPLVASALSFSCQKDTPDTLPLYSDVQYADMTGARIAWQSAGSGEPLLLCMGFATNMDMWSTGAVEALSKQYKVIVFDYPGMGYSTTGDTAQTISSMADAAAALLDALHIDNAHVMGWSMGSYVAQMLAIRYPEKISKLILYAADCGDTITVNPSQEIIDILSNPNSTPMEFLSTLFPDDWLAAHAEPWTFLPEGKEPENAETIGMQYGAIQQWLSPEGGSNGQLQQLTMPVLLLCGSDDKVVPAANSTMMAGSIPTATLISVAGTGHGLMYQQPETFANYVLSFLNNNLLESRN